MVFSEEKDSYYEIDDELNPINFYGQTKVRRRTCCTRNIREIFYCTHIMGVWQAWE